jgi:hypothetical protein
MPPEPREPEAAIIQPTQNRRGSLVRNFLSDEGADGDRQLPGCAGLRGGDGMRPARCAKRAFALQSGQDHSGLGSVSSDRILPSLSPGINATIHPCYWSCHSWVLDEFWAADLAAHPQRVP